ncbi:dUTP diphosphatase [Thomasclavelia sp.]|uniref:dUTP diphosphatase n=1 Tax=Thomasclavelia sp. TaxID=3025757 RepID=UPI0025E8192F|nr:dUTP diphosphatase [Thomasclavelia sp.]
MQVVAKFEKVSKQQFIKDFQDTFTNYDSETINQIYENLKLPKRATTGSAGYDFYTPIDFTLNPQETIKIPTGIRVKINEGWFLAIYPRSGLGFKYRLQLNNTVGIIDSDYYFSDNQGHIFIKVTNDSNEAKTVVLKANQGFAQGIFMPFGIVEDDDTNTIRNGGFGSTTK